MPLGTIGELILQYKYLVMVPLIPVAQPLVGMISGVFVRLEIMEFIPVYFVLVSVALVGDMAWYWVGYHYGERFVNRFGRYVSVTAAHVEHIKHVFQHYHAPILFFSKLVNGLGLAIAVLFTAGLTRVPFGRYMFFNIIGELVWSGMLVTIGYFFGEAYVRVHDIFGRVVLTALFVLVLLGMMGAALYVRRRLGRVSSQ